MPYSKNIPATLPAKKQEIRLSIDRLWNIAFALAMTTGVLTVGIWAVPIVIIALKYFNPTKYHKDTKQYITKAGRVIAPNKDFPHPVALALGPIATALAMFLMASVTPITITALKWFILLFIVVYPVLLFNYKNCPITVLFTWTFEPYDSGDYRSRNNHNSILKRSRDEQLLNRTSLSRGYHPSNIHHKKHR